MSEKRVFVGTRGYHPAETSLWIVAESREEIAAIWFELTVDDKNGQSCFIFDVPFGQPFVEYDEDKVFITEFEPAD